MKKIKVGFVGAGWMGSVQMQRITDTDDGRVAGEHLLADEIESKTIVKNTVK